MTHYEWLTLFWVLFGVFNAFRYKTLDTANFWGPMTIASVQIAISKFTGDMAELVQALSS